MGPIAGRQRIGRGDINSIATYAHQVGLNGAIAFKSDGESELIGNGGVLLVDHLGRTYLVRLNPHGHRHGFSTLVSEITSVNSHVAGELQRRTEPGHRSVVDVDHRHGETLIVGSRAAVGDLDGDTKRALVLVVRRFRVQQFQCRAVGVDLEHTALVGGNGERERVARIDIHRRQRTHRGAGGILVNRSRGERDVRGRIVGVAHQDGRIGSGGTVGRRPAVRGIDILVRAVNTVGLVPGPEGDGGIGHRGAAVRPEVLVRQEPDLVTRPEQQRMGAGQAAVIYSGPVGTGVSRVLPGAVGVINRRYGHAQRSVVVVGDYTAAGQKLAHVIAGVGALSQVLGDGRQCVRRTDEGRRIVDGHVDLARILQGAARPGITLVVYRQQDELITAGAGVAPEGDGSQGVIDIRQCTGEGHQGIGCPGTNVEDQVGGTGKRQFTVAELDCQADLEITALDIHISHLGARDIKVGHHGRLLRVGYRYHRGVVHLGYRHRDATGGGSAGVAVGEHEINGPRSGGGIVGVGVLVGDAPHQGAGTDSLGVGGQSHYQVGPARAAGKGTDSGPFVGDIASGDTDLTGAGTDIVNGQHILGGFAAGGDGYRQQAGVEVGTVNISHGRVPALVDDLCAVTFIVSQRVGVQVADDRDVVNRGDGHRDAARIRERAARALRAAVHVVEGEVYLGTGGRILIAVGVSNRLQNLVDSRRCGVGVECQYKRTAAVLCYRTDGGSTQGEG